MYTISNKQREDIIKFLAAFQDLPAKDNKTFNMKRRAKLLRKKLLMQLPINNLKG